MRNALHKPLECSEKKSLNGHREMKVKREFFNSTKDDWETLWFYVACAAPMRPEGSGL